MSKLAFDVEYGFKAKDLKDLVNNCFTSVDKIQNKEAILFLGTTGAGKSTVINQLLGVKYKTGLDDKTGTYFLKPDVKSAAELAKVGHKSSSETLYPQIYEDLNHKLIYCDLPGFDDNRKLSTQICSHFGVPVAMQKAAAVKSIVAVIDWPSVVNSRGRILDKVFSDIGLIVQSKEAFFNDEMGKASDSIFFVLTKVDPNLQHSQAIAKLGEFLRDEDTDRLESLLERQQNLREGLDKSLNPRDRNNKLKEVDKEIMKLRGKIRMLLLLQKQSYHVFLHDSQGGAQVEKLRTLLQQAAVIPKSQLQPISDHPVIEKIAKKSIQLNDDRGNHLKNLARLDEEIYGISTKVTFIDKAIERAKLDQTKNDLSASQLTQEFNNAEQQIRALDRELSNHKEDREVLEKSLAKVAKEIAELDTKDRIVHFRQTLVVKEQSWLSVFGSIGKAVGTIASKFTGLPFLSDLGEAGGKALSSLLREEARVEYDDLPYVHVDKNPDTGFNNDEYAVPQSGTYYVTFCPPGNAGGKAEVKILVEKHVLHKNRIDALLRRQHEIQKEIKEINKTADILGDSKKRWNKIIDDLNKKQQLNYQNIIDCLQSDKKALLLKQSECFHEKDRIHILFKQLDDTIRSNHVWFELLNDLSKLLPFSQYSSVPIFARKYGLTHLTNYLSNVKLGEEKGFVFRPRRILQGRLPSGQSASFEEFEAQSDGSCGFHVLGISRKELVDKLLPLAGNAQIRKELAPEILNALGGNDIGSATTKASQELFERYAKLLKEAPVIEQTANNLIKKIESEVDNKGLSNLIVHFKKKANLHKEYAEMLKKLEDYHGQVQQCEREMEQFTCSEQAYTSYVNSLGNMTWLGYKSAKLFAGLNHINLYIWSKSTKDANTVELRDSYFDPNNQNTIHMLHTNGFTHFNLLAEPVDMDFEIGLAQQHGAPITWLKDNAKTMASSSAASPASAVSSTKDEKAKYLF